MEKQKYDKYIQKIVHRQKQKDGSWKEVEVPYMRVDGRVAEFNDWVEEKGYRYIATPEIKQIGEEMVYMIKIQVFDQSMKIVKETVGMAKIGFGGQFVDATNPIENAETSAWGRALGFMNFGLLGGGIASAEEIERVTMEQNRLKKTITEKKNGASEYLTDEEWEEVKKLFWHEQSRLGDKIYWETIMKEGIKELNDLRKEKKEKIRKIYLKIKSLKKDEDIKTGNE